MSYCVAVAGASGYAGGELLRLIAEHPQLELSTATAHANAGVRIRDIHPHLASVGNMTFAPTEAEELRDHDAVFFALPHGASAELAAELADDDAVLIDCGADHRLESADDWADYYGGEHAGAWTYGMPELPMADGGKQRDLLKDATRIAVPGCNVTAMTFAFAPLASGEIAQMRDLTAVLAVGPSGAGRVPKATMLASELAGSAVPYGAAGAHRHNPEVRQNLRRAGANEVSLTFTPVLVPMARGISATCTAKLEDGVTLERIRERFTQVYGGERFIEVLPDGVWPRSGDVAGSNRCSIGFGIDERAGRVVINSAIDNLGKGTAGAAIQSLNIALGMDEHLGLSIDGVAP